MQLISRQKHGWSFYKDIYMIYIVTINYWEASFQKKVDEAIVSSVLWNKVFLKISQISLENTCVGVSF